MDNLFKPSTTPGGFAQLPSGLVLIWPRLPEHFRLVLPALLSFMPDCRPS